MKIKYILTTIVLICSLSLTIFANREVYFSGGPDGGTFKYFARGISEHLNKVTNVAYKNLPSNGSIDNLEKVNNRSADLGITYSGDLYLGRNGMLDRKSRQYRNVYAVAYLYGAPAHLVVLKDSGINTVADLSLVKKLLLVVWVQCCYSFKKIF